MKFLTPAVVNWMFVILAVAVAVSANAVSTKWAGAGNLANPVKNPWMIPMIILAIATFVTFGMTSARVGLALGSASIDSLLTVTTILVGLFLFKEWKTFSSAQAIGVIAIIIGIVLTQFPKSP